MENEKIKNVMLWLNIIKGYADYISDDDITIAINTKGILVAVSTNSGKSVYIPIKKCCITAAYADVTSYVTDFQVW